MQSTYQRRQQSSMSEEVTEAAVNARPPVATATVRNDSMMIADNQISQLDIATEGSTSALAHRQQSKASPQRADAELDDDDSDSVDSTWSSTALGLGRRRDSEETTTGSTEDLSTTPGVHTGALRYFPLSTARTSSPVMPNYVDYEPASPTPNTLDAYLTSTLSSPRARTLSSGSLSSFRTDMLSDYDDRDEAALSEPDSSHGRHSIQRDVRSTITGTHSGLPRAHGLVMPRAASRASVSESSSSQEHASAQASCSETSAGPNRILVVGGTQLQQRQMLASLGGDGDMSTMRPAVAASVSSGISSLVASFEDLAYSEADFGIPSSGPAATAQRHRRCRIVCEAVPTLEDAAIRTAKPFQSLRSLLVPPQPGNSATEIYHRVLPSVLEQACPVQICLWLLPATQDSLRALLSKHARHLQAISGMCSLIPIATSAHFDAASVLRSSTACIPVCRVDQTGKNLLRPGSPTSGRLPSVKDVVAGDLLESLCREYASMADIATKYRTWAEEQATPNQDASFASTSAQLHPIRSSDSESIPLGRSLSTSLAASIEVPTTAASAAAVSLGSLPTTSVTGSGQAATHRRSAQAQCVDPFHFRTLLQLSASAMFERLASLRRTVLECLQSTVAAVATAPLSVPVAAAKGRAQSMQVSNLLYLAGPVLARAASRYSGPLVLLACVSAIAWVI